MERAQPTPLAPAAQRCEAWAFDRRRRNRRRAFTMQQSLQAGADGRWQSRREWRAVGPEPVATEALVWRDGLVESRCEQPSLDELAVATPQPQGCHCLRRSPRTGGAVRERWLALPHAPVTLASLVSPGVSPGVPR